MLGIAHNFLIAIYVGLPALMIVVVLLRGRYISHHARRALRQVGVAILLCLLLGAGAAIIYGIRLGELLNLGQALLLGYWIAGLICLLKILDWLIERIANLIFLVGHGMWMATDRKVAAQMVRVFLLFLIGLPYMIVVAATYHPHVEPENRDASRDLPATEITFESTDGVHLSGQWRSAGTTQPSRRQNVWGKETILLCGDEPSAAAFPRSLVTSFLSAGYNVMSFDLREFGHSNGQLVSFGKGERQDVLGAVRWARKADPEACHRIIAVGVGSGGAAVLGAAADPSPEGHAIGSVVVYGTFGRFTEWASSLPLRYMPPPFDVFNPELQWVITNVGIPLASVQTGEDLYHFLPARDAAAIAPRPIMFVHSHRDPLVPFYQGQELYEQANQPKSNVWADDPELAPLNTAPNGQTPAQPGQQQAPPAQRGTVQDAVLRDPDVIKRVQFFIDSYRPVL